MKIVEGNRVIDFLLPLLFSYFRYDSKFSERGPCTECVHFQI